MRGLIDGVGREKSKGRGLVSSSKLLKKMGTTEDSFKQPVADQTSMVGEEQAYISVVGTRSTCNNNLDKITKNRKGSRIP